MKNLLSLIVVSFILIGTSSGQLINPHRFDRVLSRGQGVQANIVPYANVNVCVAPSTGTPCTPVASIYYDENLTQPVTQPLVADKDGNFSYYVPPGVCVDEFISAPGQGTQTTLNICPPERTNGLVTFQGRANPAAVLLTTDISSVLGPLTNCGTAGAVYSPASNQCFLGVPPSGTAGGDLSGTFPNPTVINQVRIGSTAGGDLAGTYPNPTVPGMVRLTPSSGNQNVTQPSSTSLNVNNLNGRINAAFYCTTPFVLDQTCLENAAAIANGATIFVPAGNYSGTLSIINRSNLHIILDANTSLNYVLDIQGTGFSRSNTVTVTGSFTTGATTFNGNFSAYSPGQTVVIEQGTGGGSIPTDFGIVSTASGTQLVLTTGIRFTYTNPVISQVANTTRDGSSIPTFSNTIPGNYTPYFVAGDVIRVENMTGTDSPRGSSNYFEFARVASINSSAITLETALHSAYGTPWLAKENVASNVSIEGNQGFIQNAGVRFSRNVSIQNLSTNVLNAEYLYDAQLNHLHGNANNATGGAFYWTYIFNGAISNVNAYGGNAAADSGNIQAVSLQGVTLTNIATWQGTDTVQGSYPFDMDFVFTPYEVPNAFDTITGISVGTTQSTVTGFSVFMAGLKSTSVTSLSTPAAFVLLNGSLATLSNINIGGSININSGTAYKLNNFSADSLTIGSTSAVSNSIFSNFTIAGGASENSNSAISVLSGSSNDRFLHGEFTQSNLTIDTIQAQSASTGMYYEDLQDHAGTNLSFSLFTNGTGSHMLVGNRFASNVQGPNPAVSIPSIVNTPQVGTPTVGNIACIKAAGPPVVIGFCSAAVVAGGTCTCN